MSKFLFCFGTRPEAIKMAPVISEAGRRGHEVRVCITGQHKEMLSPFLTFFGIHSDYSLNVMLNNQTLTSLTARLLVGIEDVIRDAKPDIVFVQGDTTTTFASALGAFYQKVDIAYVEAGLRTGDIYSPFPEEGNRRLVTPLAKYFFAPTLQSSENLAREGVSNNVIVTGNTGIDALRCVIEKIQSSETEKLLLNRYSALNFNKKIILVTVHRRENHGEPLRRICESISFIAQKYDFEIVVPVHLNPQVKAVVTEKLGRFSNVHLLPPLEYVDFCWLMSRSHIILTDSGGVQEEGPFFRKPILILRENTERPEGVSAGVAKLVGSNYEKIIGEVAALSEENAYYSSFSRNENPYGDGYASKVVLDFLE